MKKKYPENKKKKKLTLTINQELSKLLDEYMLENDIFNKSEFIEKLIKNQLIENVNLVNYTELY